MPTRTDAATECFAKGYNCAQAVFSAYATSVGIKDKDALRIAAAFGAGMGRQQEVCGAVTGACMAIGAQYGMVDSANPQAKEHTYALVADFMQRFREMHSSIICLDLLGCDMGTEEGRKEIAARKLHTEVCLPCVQDACKILEEMLPAITDLRQ
jgi:C_GCAxxG_C_C family probable redox protein